MMLAPVSAVVSSRAKALAARSSQREATSSRRLFPPPAAVSLGGVGQGRVLTEETGGTAASVAALSILVLVRRKYFGYLHCVSTVYVHSHTHYAQNRCECTHVSRMRTLLQTYSAVLHICTCDAFTRLGHVYSSSYDRPILYKGTLAPA